MKVQPTDTAVLLDRIADLRARIKTLENALHQIGKCEARFSNDPLEHCHNAIEHMRQIARDVL